MIVSLDGPPEIHDRIRRVPGAFERIAAGVHEIHAQRPEIQIGARCTVQKANHAALVDTACAARRIGLASISFLAADLTSAAFNRAEPWSASRQSEIALTIDEIAVLEQEIGKLVDDSFVIDRPQHLHRIVRHFRAQIGLEPFEAPRCNAPWVSAVMEIDGSVRPCFFHPPVGSVSSHPLDEALNAPRAQGVSRIGRYCQQSHLPAVRLLALSLDSDLAPGTGRLKGSERAIPSVIV